MGRWYNTLERWFGSKGGIDVALKKITVDQLLFSPISLFIVICVLEYARGRELKQIKEDLKTKYFDILITNYEVRLNSNYEINLNKESQTVVN